MANKLPRAQAKFTRKDSTALLTSPDRKTVARVKVCFDGDVLLEITRNGKAERHDFTATERAQGNATEFEQLIRKVERTFDGDSNDAEHDATVDLVDFLKTNGRFLALERFDHALETNGAEYSEITRTFGLLAANLGMPGRDLLGLLNRAYNTEPQN